MKSNRLRLLSLAVVGAPLIERRHAAASSVYRELRARASIERRALTDAEKSAGYIGALNGVIPFNSDSVVLSKRGRAKPFVEQIAPEAFKRSLTEDKDIMANAGHTDDPLAALGRIGENLTVTQTATEMRWEALLPDTPAARAMLQLVEKRIITGTSFEFEVRGAAGEKWEKRDDKLDQRTILDARLIAFNPVTWPAYADSSLTVEMRRRKQADGADERGTYYRPEGCPVDYCDPTLTADAKFAGIALSRATYALTDALEYLRAMPAGALADYAKAEVTIAAANAKTLIDWLAANGATVAPAVQQRAAEALGEAATLSHESPPSARETRLRILT
jgi:uncharacterized protein